MINRDTEKKGNGNHNTKRCHQRVMNLTELSNKTRGFAEWI